MNRSEKKRARRKHRAEANAKRRADERRLHNRQVREARALARGDLGRLSGVSLDVALAATDPLNAFHGHLGHHSEPVVLLERERPRVVPGSIEEAIEQLDPSGVLRAAYGMGKKEG